MTETGWIIVILVAVVAIILAVVLLRRKGPDAVQSPAPVADDLLPEQVTLPVSEPEPHADTSYPQEPLASIVPPAPEEIVAAPTPAPTEEPVVPIDLSGALAENDEPEVASLAPPAQAPAPAPAETGAEGDNLLRLKGVGPKIATLLKEEGITRYAQIAAWGDADLAAIDAKLGSFAGRPKRDNWVDQANLLAAGDVAGYEAKYGKL